MSDASKIVLKISEKIKTLENLDKDNFRNLCKNKNYKDILLESDTSSQFSDNCINSIDEIDVKINQLTIINEINSLFSEFQNLKKELNEFEPYINYLMENFVKEQYIMKNGNYYDNKQTLE